MGDVILMIVVSLLLAPAIRRLMGALAKTMSGSPGPSSKVPAQGVQMERDPVCGTFVVPNAAVTVTDAGRRLYFCSPACRDRYRAQRSRPAGSSHSERAEGRTA